MKRKLIKSFQILKNQIGVTLLLTVLVLSMMSLAVFAIATIVIVERRLSETATKSVEAIFAAETGVEWKLYDLRKGGAALPVMENGASFDLSGSSGDTVISVGQDRNGFASRAIKVETAVGGGPLPPSAIYGTGDDGNGGSSSPVVNLNTMSVVGRPFADAKRFFVGALSAGQDRIDLAGAADGLANGDEILVIGLQTPPTTDPVNVGKWETVRIQSITGGNRLNLANPLVNNYPARTIIQRVPNYNSLTINNNQTYTIDSWTGVEGGVFFIRVKNLLAINTGGKIDVKSKGFRGGDLGYMYYEALPGCDCWRSNWGRAGESVDGLAPVYNGEDDPVGALAREPNYGGGGGASFSGHSGGGGGNYGGGAESGNYTTSIYSPFNPCPPGVPGSTETRRGLAGQIYGGDLTTRLFLGSGGGGGMDGTATGSGWSGSAGANGGGIVVVYASIINNNGEINANGADSQGDKYGTGGGGSGGSLLVQADRFVNPGVKTNAGGVGGTPLSLGCGTPPTNNGKGGNGGSGVPSGFVDSVPPTVSITAPSGGDTVYETVTVSAAASDNVGVIDVQFKLDGNNLGAADAFSPYSVTWDTTSATEGPHTLTAVARDAAGNQTTSAPVAITVSRLPAPVASWPMNEAFGSTVADSVGNNDGTAFGTTIVAGISGNARSLNGTDTDRISVPHNSVFNGNNNLTVSYWKKPASESELPYDLYKCYTPGCGGDWNIGMDNTTAAFYMYNTGFAAFGLSCPGSYADGNWHYVAGTYDVSTNQIKLYIDGVSCGAPATFAGAHRTGSSSLGIGGLPVDSFPEQYYMNGIIDEAQIHNTVLTVDQICGVYKSKTGRPSCP